MVLFLIVGLADPGAHGVAPSTRRRRRPRRAGVAAECSHCYFCMVMCLWNESTGAASVLAPMAARLSHGRPTLLKMLPL